MSPITVANTHQQLSTIIHTVQYQIPTRRVHFSSTNPVQVLCYVQPCSTMTMDELTQLWYSQSELQSLKKEARAISRTIRQILCTQRDSNDSESSSDDETICDDTKICCRGFELRIYSERCKRKRMAIRGVLEAQERMKACSYVNVDKLASISDGLTKRARMIARRDGERDNMIDHCACGICSLKRASPPTSRRTMKRLRPVRDINTQISFSGVAHISSEETGSKRRCVPGVPSANTRQYFTGALSPICSFPMEINQQILLSQAYQLQYQIQLNVALLAPVTVL